MTTNQPLISVIVPNYNHEKYLTKRLDTIFNQSYSNIEVILLDDCSTDNSREILSKYALEKKVSHCVFNTVNSGNTFKQCKKGVDLAKGDFIWIAESDDYCDSDFLEKLIVSLLSDEEVVLSYCQSNRVNQYEEVTGNWKTHTDDLDVKQFSEDFALEGNIFIEKYLIYKNVIPNASAVLLRKKTITEINFFDNDTILKYCGDWQLYFQLLVNHKVSFLANSFNNFRYHSESVIASAIKTEKRLSIIDTDFQMREGLMRYLKTKRPYNFSAVDRNNRETIKILKYEKVFILLRNKNYIKAFLIFLSILPFFIKKYNFKKRVLLKIKKCTE